MVTGRGGEPVAMPTVQERSLLDHVGPWTVDDLYDYDWDVGHHRVEILDGALLMVPQPDVVHDGVCTRLIVALDRACPSHLVVGSKVGVSYGSSYRVPDVIAYLRDRRRHGYRLKPADLVLAVEVMSPSSVRTDRHDKPAEYAEVGIANYWRVEIDPEPILFAYALRDGVYVEVAKVRGDDVYRAAEPFPVEITPSRLLD